MNIPKIIQNNDPKNIWSLPDFPSKDFEEEIKIFLRQDISVVVGKAKLFFLVIALLFLFKLAFLNIFDTPAWAYFLDVVIYGSSCVFLVILAYLFHNYYLSLIVFTNQRCILYNQVNLILVDIQILKLKDLEDINIERIKAREIVSGVGNLVLKLKDKTQVILYQIYSPEELKIELLKFIKLPEKKEEKSKD
jgi:hypothetical protein